VDGEHFRLPYSALEVRFPKGEDNTLLPACAVLVARLNNDDLLCAWDDGRDWTFVVMWFDNVPEFSTRDDAGRYHIAAIPVRKGLLLEDALDQTALIQFAKDPGLCRRIVRVAVGVCFFAMDRHELILPEVRRKVIDRYIAARRQPTPAEVEEALRDAREHGMGNGYKLGSELVLPRPLVRTHGIGEGGERVDGHELTHGHIRRGHMKMQPHGKERKQKKLIFVAPTVVRPDLPLGATRGHQVRIK
jgi:hypothetical protein